MKYIKSKKLFETKETKLYYSGNNLSELPVLPDTLKYLACYNNQLTFLPELPDTLEELYCDNNKLTILPELPKSLERLNCKNNQLTVLPELPNSLEILWCDNNQLLSLPDLYFHKNLTYLFCLNNNLPYNNLKSYRLWYEKTYPEKVKASEFNI